MSFDIHPTDQLAAYLDHELTVGDRALLEDHLNACEPCRRSLDQVRAGRAAVEVLPLAEAPEGLWDAIYAEATSRRNRLSAARAMWRVAAAVLLIASVAGAYWMLSRPPVGAWEVVALDGVPVVGKRQLSGAQQVPVGQWIETDNASRARIVVGKIGSVEVQPDTRLRIVSTSESGHRLALQNGRITATISAPPRLFFVETPAATAVDLGCEFQMQCDRTGNGILKVSAGWVSLEWKGRESLVPAGASCRIYSGSGPGTPWFDDAPAGLVQALEQFDLNRSQERLLPSVIAGARIRDTLTLWHLLSQVGADYRATIFDRMAALAPPPSGVSRDAVLNLDSTSLKRWREELAWTW
ncbi:MAG: FecR domain-containing protein [Bryobacteraceae bacterium]|nr:FecR domain-containing protein [Bryobacteraceae bacterium]